MRLTVNQHGCMFNVNHELDLVELENCEANKIYFRLEMRAKMHEV